MRGWLHFWSFVVSIGSGAVLVAVAAALVGADAALATAVYSVTILGLFGVSALYHRHTWRTPRARAIMKRLDHSMIFLFIDRKSTRLNSSHVEISYAVFCLKK